MDTNTPTQKVVIQGLNRIPVGQPSYHAHRAGCVNLRDYDKQSGWEINVADKREVVEDIYVDIVRERLQELTPEERRDPDCKAKILDELMEDVKFFPCLEGVI